MGCRCRYLQWDTMREWVFSEIFLAFEALFRAHWLLAPRWVSPLSGRCTHLNAGRDLIAPGTGDRAMVDTGPDNVLSSHRQPPKEWGIPKMTIKSSLWLNGYSGLFIWGSQMEKQDLEPNNTRWERKVEIKILLIVYWKGLKAIIRSKIQEWQASVWNPPPNPTLVL